MFCLKTECGKYLCGLFPKVSRQEDESTVELVLGRVS